jgi:Glycoside hydrolase 123, catalytic domain
MKNRHTTFSLRLLAILGLTVWGETTASEAQRIERPVRVWVEGSLTRVQPTTPPGSKKTVEIAAARNEVESFQVIVSSSGPKLEGVTAFASDLSDATGHRISSAHIKLYRQEYVYLRNPSPYSPEPPGWWPDPLVPFLNPYDGKPISAMRLNREEQNGKISYQLSGARFAGNGFTVWPERSQPLWGEVAIPANQPPGIYQGTFSVQLAASDTVEIPIKLTVWDLTLPDSLPLTTQFGSLDGVSAKHGVPDGSPQSLEIEERYAAALEEHRIAAPIPSALLPIIRPNGSIDTRKNHEALKRYLTQHRTGPFRIPVFPSNGKGKKAFVRYLREFFAYLKENGWERGAYYFPVAEPNSKEAYDRVRAVAQLVHEAEPSIRVLCTEQPYTQDSSWGDLHGAVDIWCPLFTFFDGERAARARERGEVVWSYTALCQKAPPYHPDFATVGGQPGMFWQIDFPLLNYRLPLWLNWRNKIEGLLYWSAVHWGDPERDVWTDPAFRNRYNGEGYLLYPGGEAGILGPVPSLRIKALRDGLEDYAYFSLLAGLGESDFVEKETAKIAHSWWKWEEDAERIYAVRAAIAKRIQEKQRTLAP